MDTTQILPNIGSPVSSPAFDPSAADEMSVGEAAYAAAFFANVAVKRMADPAAAGEFARFVTASGEDWTGFKPSAAPPAVTEDDAGQAAGAAEPHDAPSGAAEQARSIPVPPENYYDSLPGIAHMLRHQQRATDALLTHFAAHLEPAMSDQAVMLGTPEGVKGYRNTSIYFREVLKLSTAQTKKIHDRVPYVTWAPGMDPSLAAYHPNLVKVAKSYAAGRISGENLDRIISMDKDLTKYVHKTKALPEVKREILLAFEEALVDAAEALTPDELSEAKSRWANKIAHAIDPDGPLVADAIRKQPDNAIRTQNLADGSGKISMHATPAVYATFKNWILHQLNYNGTPVEIPQEVFDLLATDDQEEPEPADAYNDLDDLKSAPDPDATAEDPDGNTRSAQATAEIDPLTTGQRAAAILIGMFQNLLTMDPKDLGAKKAHGASAQLMIVQDIQTAYETLGVGALPEAVRRPPEAAGVLPPSITVPNPDDQPVCLNPDHTRGHSPPSWTQFMSEAVNIGSIRPHDAAPLACDSKLVGQIWNGDHDVLAQYRAHRLFTPTQRRAILARDRGCQAPGCTVPAVYCQIHHITEWLNNGTTNVDNAITLCAHHHGAVHNGKWKIRKHHGATFFQPAPWLDPTQPLLRNLYWAL
ncbi:hypothetical protein GCM10023190_24650 [Enteractinococcus fodinae]|uniref:HNH nuclease domain-containing protein n=1 Tax=Enteractinococcus fodinae TaxID=684663 RepID=A0ABU2B5U6_9MICC|nr:HNH endonuclease signature motif containing protein [Enteractinococcus fodinae]MDR7347769.1 hypothetical protein [Enteractinococcus fodinae]